MSQPFYPAQHGTVGNDDEPIQYPPYRGVPPRIKLAAGGGLGRNLQREGQEGRRILFLINFWTNQRVEQKAERRCFEFERRQKR